VVCAADAATPPAFLSRRRRRPPSVGAPPRTLYRCELNGRRGLGKFVGFLTSYFPLDMKHINSQFIRVSANAAFRDFHYTLDIHLISEAYYEKYV
jgi:hypothetical protein